VAKIKAKIFILGLLLFLLAITFVSADVSIDNDRVRLGVDYSDFNDDDQEHLIETTDTFTLTNTDNSNVTLTVSATGLPDDYYVTDKTVTINGNSSQQVSLELNVTHDQNAGEKDIGTITVKNQAGTQLTSATLTQNTTSMLELKEIEIEYVNDDDGKESEDFNDDEEYDLEEKVGIGTEFTLVVKLKNLFDDDYKSKYSDLENIVVTIDPDDRDLFTEDVDDFDLDDLEADDEAELKVELTIDEEADDGDYSIDITIEAEDGKNAEYKIERTINLDLNRKDNDLRITKLETSPLNIDLCQDNFLIDVRVKNYGNDDQRYAAVSVYSKELNINQNFNDFKIESFDDNDNTWQKTLNIPLEGISAGTYDIDVNVDYDRDENTDFERLRVVVDECASDDPTPDDTQNANDTTNNGSTANDNNQPSGSSSSGGSISDIINTVEPSFNESNYLTIILVVGVALILVMIIIFVMVLLKR
jgi:uncharacterized membrane protein